MKTVNESYEFEHPQIVGLVMMAWSMIPNTGVVRQYWAYTESIHGLTVGKDVWTASVRTIDRKRGVVLHVRRGEYGGERSSESWFFPEEFLNNSRCTLASVPVQV